MMRTAVIIKANDTQVFHSQLFIDSLKDPLKGNYKGDIWVISTGLSDNAKYFLQKNNIRVFVNEMVDLKNWPYYVPIAKAQPLYKTLKNIPHYKHIDLSFNSYRNKRMSELNIIGWSELYGEQYDLVAMCDCDVLIQSDFNKVFESCAQDKNKIYYQEEFNPIVPGTFLWKKDQALKSFYCIDFPTNNYHEINLGCLIGTPKLLREVFTEAKTLFYSLPQYLFTHKLWHVQDIVRLIRLKKPDIFSLFDRSFVWHLCNGGDSIVKEKEDQYFFLNGEMPSLIHFAGQKWKQYSNPLLSIFSSSEENFFKNYISRESYDRRSAFSRLNFDTICSHISSEKILKKRAETRCNYIKMRENKPTLLYITTLSAGSHKDLYKCIGSGLKSNDSLNVVVLNSNYNKSKYDDLIVEDIPEGIANITNLHQHSSLVNQFSAKDPCIPESLIADAIEAIQREYSCSALQARTFANLSFYYFLSVYKFYKPTFIAGFRYAPCFRVAYMVAQHLNIPYFCVEWGVLGGTYAFDIWGNMADSFVTKLSTKFTQLPIDAKDLDNAKKYLAWFNEVGFNRNNFDESSDSYILKLLEEYRNANYKIVIIIGSNDAHSGNCGLGDVNNHAPYFHTNLEMINGVISSIDDSAVKIFYKYHPIEKTRINSLRLSFPKIHFISSLSIKTCCKYMDLAVCNVSQACYDIALYGKPVLMVGRNQINDSGAVYTINSCEELKSSILNALNRGVTLEQQNKLISHVARLLKYYLYDFTNNNFARSIENFSSDMLAEFLGEKPRNHEFQLQKFKEFNCNKIIYEKDEFDLSVIIPCYNCEEFIFNALNSLINQTVQCKEIICVENGSTDDTKNILSYISKIYTNIKVYNLEKASATIARNYGIKNATSKYIYLMDADDTLDLDAFEKIKKNIDQHQDCDAYYFGFREENESYKYYPSRWYFIQQLFGLNKVSEIKLEYYKYLLYIPFPFAKIISREFLIKNNIFVDESIYFGDDCLLNVSILAYAKYIVLDTNCYYSYLKRSNSITNKVDLFFFDTIKVLSIGQKHLEQNNRYNFMKDIYSLLKMQLGYYGYQHVPSNKQYDYLVELHDLFEGDNYDNINYSLFRVLPFVNFENMRFFNMFIRKGLPSRFMFEGSKHKALVKLYKFFVKPVLKIFK